ncbi:MAG: serine/threonine-protein kinase [Myxococcota bacterium]
MSAYTRVCELAKGGMGRVDLAVRRDGAFRRLFAVKRLRESYRDDSDFRAMFLDEARIAGFLRHPKVVSVVDVGEDDDGPFLVLEYVSGVSLSELISRVRQRGGEVPLTVALRIALQVAEGLHAAHELRDPETGSALHLVHRDVSPQNVLLSYDGAARVTDFGIAKALGRITKTNTGVLKGKMGYMAPEVLRFEDPDRRSDLFSFGVVLFEMLIARRLYANREGMDGARRILNEAPPDLGEEREDAPAELVELMFRLLAKDPNHRPTSSLEVARALESILADLRGEAPVVELGDYLGELFAEEKRAREARVQEALREAEARSQRPPPPPAGRASPRAIGAIATVVVVLVGGAAWALASTFGSSAEEAPQATEVRPAPEPPPRETSVEPQNVLRAAPEERAEEVDVEPEEATPMRRRRPRKRRSAMRGGTPMWDWQ